MAERVIKVPSMRNVQAFREGILSYSASQLQTAAMPWQVLQSGWPIFGLLGLVAYKLSRDGAGKDAVCEQPTESFRIRYEDGMPVERAQLFDGQRFSRSYWHFAENNMSLDYDCRGFSGFLFSSWFSFSLHSAAPGGHVVREGGPL